MKFSFKIYSAKAKIDIGLPNPNGLKYLTRLSHLREHKFKHNFQDSINPLCSWEGVVETAEHFFLHCQNFSHFRLTLLNSLANIDPDLPNMECEELTDLLLYSNSKFISTLNNKNLSCSIQFILSSDRFSVNLFEQ